MRIQVSALHAIGILLCVATPQLTQLRATDAQPDAKSGEIIIRAIDGAGAPKAGATVSLWIYDRDLQTYTKTSTDAEADRFGVARHQHLPTDGACIVRATTRENLVGYRECVLTDSAAHQEVSLKVLEPSAVRIHVRNEAGKPVQGATIWSISDDGPNGSIWFARTGLFESWGVTVGPSDETGLLMVPELPSGKLDVKLIHPNYAPCELKGIKVEKQAAVDVTLPAGIRVTFKIEMDGRPSHVTGLGLRLAHSRDEHPSSLTGPLPAMRPDGTVQMTVAAGKYSLLRLTHPDYLITPEYSWLAGHGPTDDGEFFEIKPGADEFTFQVHRKFKVRGRAVDASNHKPVANVSVISFLEAGENNSPFARFAKERDAGYSETNDRGEFDVDVAAGTAGLYFASGHYVWPTRYRVDVTAGQSTLDHDILIKPTAKVRGVVEDERGKPVAGAVVRFRGSELNEACRSAVSDSQGRFELSPPFVPTDWKTQEPKPEQTLVVFHPYKPLGADIELHLDGSTALDNVVLRLKPQDFGQMVTGYPAELRPFERGTVPSDQKDHLAAMSLAGKPAPELDGAAWLNVDKPKMSLADFRGKFVLLQFWTTWCGVCHWDLPNLKLAHDLYKDKGLIVIGVHDNSMPLDAIKEDAAKNGMTWPIVVDQPDGRIVASYTQRGFQGFPSYILIGPDGKVIKDDQTVPTPNLFSFKTEIIRQKLMSRTDNP
jgi:thiol-disulfide isomerase/thioredoxin